MDEEEMLGRLKAELARQARSQNAHFEDAVLDYSTDEDPELRADYVRFGGTLDVRALARAAIGPVSQAN